ncbi:MAG TPA: hypothetical protein VEB21_19950 [Terriglobales bacterium]|nr:hypothetical protein [Terriglobales bacterium]
MISLIFRGIVVLCVLAIVQPLAAQCVTQYYGTNNASSIGVLRGSGWLVAPPIGGVIDI